MASGTVANNTMLGIYNDLLNRNVENYGNVMNAYAQGQSRLNDALPGIGGAYGQINKEVQNILGMGAALGENDNWGVAAPAAKAIRDTMIQTKAQNDQRMISSGLGNSTIRANMNQQTAIQGANAFGALGAQLADKAAGARQSIGLAQQAAQMQGLGMQTGLSQAQGGALANFHFANTAGNLLGSYSTDPVGGGGGVGGRVGSTSGPLDTGSISRSSGIAGPGANSYSGNAGGTFIGGYGGYNYGGGGVYDGGQNLDFGGGYSDDWSDLSDASDLGFGVTYTGDDTSFIGDGWY